MLKFRSIKNSDIIETLEIYNFYIKNGLANFEEIPLSINDFKNLVTGILNMKLPFIICEEKEKILGFAYLNNFRNKSGYQYSYENTIYVSDKNIGQGIGHNLLKELIRISLKNKNIKNMVAVIGGKDSHASVKIHKKNGFKTIGVLKNIGFKKNQWIDAIYMQKILYEKN